MSYQKTISIINEQLSKIQSEINKNPKKFISKSDYETHYLSTITAINIEDLLILRINKLIKNLLPYEISELNISEYPTLNYKYLRNNTILKLYDSEDSTQIQNYFFRPTSATFIYYCKLSEEHLKNDELIISMSPRGVYSILNKKYPNLFNNEIRYTFKLNVSSILNLIK